MTHHDVLERDLVDGYVAGTLSAAERAAFEEHYFACDECFAALQAAERFRDGVRHLAASGELPAAGGPARAPRSSALPWLLAAAAVIVAAVGGWTLESRMTALGRELAGARQRADALEQALAQARTPAPVPEMQIASAAPEANVPLAILQTTRSAAAPTAFAVPPAARHFIVWLEDAPAGNEPASLALSAPDGRVLHTVTGLMPNGGGAIVASFPTEAIASGTYTLRLTSAGRSRPLGEYRLTIAR